MAKPKTATHTVTNSMQPRTQANINSGKAIGELPTESIIEYDDLVESIADPDIVKLQVQPAKIQLEVDGKFNAGTADALSVRRDGQIDSLEFRKSPRPLLQDAEAKQRATVGYRADSGYKFAVRA